MNSILNIQVSSPAHNSQTKDLMNWSSKGATSIELIIDWLIRLIRIYSSNKFG